MTAIVGHTKILSFLDKSIDKDAVNHAYLFWGPENVGKFSLALEFSAKLTQGDSSGTNSNLMVVEPKISEIKGVIKKQDIKVDEVREIQKRLSLSSERGKYNVAIINDADRLTKAAQNSLLKTLEESPAHSVIILVTGERNKLLPTVLSRCQMIKFGNLTESEIEKVLPAGVEDKAELLFWSMGRPGLASRMLANVEELVIRRESSKELGIAMSGAAHEKFSLAESWSKNVPLALEKMDFWVVLLRKKMLEETGPTKLLKLRIIEKIGDSREIIKSTNANVRLVLENLFLSF